MNSRKFHIHRGGMQFQIDKPVWNNTFVTKTILIPNFFNI